MLTNQDLPGGPARGPSPSYPRPIAFCITDLDAGGAEKAMVQLVTRLDQARWKPIVYCLGPEGELAPPLRQQGVVVHCYGATSPLHLGVIGWLTRKLREQAPVLLQCFLFHGNLVGRLAGARAGVPVVIAGHRVAEREKRWHLWLDRWTRQMVTHHVCVSQGVSQYLQRELRVPAEQMTVIPNGVEIVPASVSGLSLREEFRFAEDAPVVLAVGRLVPQKGFLDLLESFRIVLEQVPEARLLIAGEGPQRPQLEEKIGEYGLIGKIVLAGRRLDVPGIMRESTVLAVSSRWEGMPNVILEAMAHQLPVVTTNVEGVSDLIEHQVNGMVVSLGDRKGLGESIIRILAEAPLRRSLAERAYPIVNKEFTWDRAARRYEELFERLIR